MNSRPRKLTFFSLAFCVLVLFVFAGPALSQEEPIDAPAAASEADDVVRGPLGVPRSQVISVTLGLLLVVLCVLMHYECLRLLSRFLIRLRTLPRPRIVLLIVGLILVHQGEVWIWAWGYYGASFLPELGFLDGDMESPLTYVYFSVVTYTTLGYGDIVPVGPIRFMAATEALAGMVLIAWSASFTFLEMQRFWRDD